MKFLVIGTFAVVLLGCAADKQWLPPGGGLYGRSPDVVDNEKCRELGFRSGTEAYGNCRLQLEQIRTTERAATQTRQGGRQDMSMLCKDAISQGDRGGVSIFC